MKTIKIGSTGQEVKELCLYLGLKERTTFDEEIKEAVIKFQKEWSLTPDGIVGFNTWKRLYLEASTKGEIFPVSGLTTPDYVFAANLLGCELAALRAVIQVETGGRDGIMTNGKPPILFEGHVFWRELKKRGINPVNVRRGNETILYQNWTKAYYKGGTREWERLEQARKINRDAANASASWGILQIMGNNWKACGSSSLQEFVDDMCDGDVFQLMLGATFIKNNPTMLTALQKKQWTTFAKAYNGAGYAQNKYDQKLATAYKKFKG